MSSRKKLARVVIAIAATVAAIAIYVRLNGGGKTWTVETVLQDRVELAGQNLTFISRGAKYAHFQLTAFGGEDTVRAHLRQPANYRKLKALVWAYSAEQGPDMRSLLDAVRHADQVEILAYNLDSVYPRDRQGNRISNVDTEQEAFVRGKRGLELLVQFLKKHQVVDSAKIYLAGQGDGAAIAMAAATELTDRVAGIALIDLDRTLRDLNRSESGSVTNPRQWANVMRVPHVALIEPEHRASFDPQASGFELGVTPERVSMGAVLEQDSRAMLGRGLTAAVGWIMGSDTLPEPVPSTPDSIYSKTVRIPS